MRTASSTEDILTSTLTIAAPSATASTPATRYVVQPGDTLSSIAARFAVRGGWPALYTLNLRALGRNPNTIRPGTALTAARPGRPSTTRWRPGTPCPPSRPGWACAAAGQALYAANRRAIGRDPNTIRPGTVLSVPHPAAQAGARPRPPRRHPVRPPAPSSAPPVSLPAPSPAGDQSNSGGPGHAAVAEDHAAGGGPAHPGGFPRRAGTGGPPPAAAGRGQAARRRPPDSGRWPGSFCPGADSAPVPGSRPAEPSGEKGSIVLADHDRLVVTCNQRDDTVYVLRPPGEDPKAILRVARLVLPEGRYGELARQLGMPAIGPVE